MLPLHFRARRDPNPILSQAGAARALRNVSPEQLTGLEAGLGVACGLFLICLIVFLLQLSKLRAAQRGPGFAGASDSWAQPGGKPQDQTRMTQLLSMLQEEEAAKAAKARQEEMRANQEAARAAAAAAAASEAERLERERKAPRKGSMQSGASSACAREEQSRASPRSPAAAQTSRPSWMGEPEEAADPREAGEATRSCEGSCLRRRAPSFSALPPAHRVVLYFVIHVNTHRVLMRRNNRGDRGRRR